MIGKQFLVLNKIGHKTQMGMAYEIKRKESLWEFISSSFVTTRLKINQKKYKKMGLKFKKIGNRDLYVLPLRATLLSQSLRSCNKSYSARLKGYLNVEILFNFWIKSVLKLGLKKKKKVVSIVLSFATMWFYTLH